MKVKNRKHLKKLLDKDRKSFDKEFSINSTLPKGAKIVIEPKYYAR